MVGSFVLGDNKRMAKPDMLSIVQEILNDIDGDEVNSISDLILSEQIANIVASTYKAMITSKDWPHTRGLVQLVASGDSSKPTHMTFNEDFKKIISVKYNKIRTGETRLMFLPVKFMNADDFLVMSNARDSDATNIDNVTDDSGIILLVRNDIPPEFYTSFDDETLVFDAYDSLVDTTLQASKTQVAAYRLPSITIADDHVPDLPLEAFPLLIEESKSKASLKLNQQEDVKAELEARKQGAWMSKNDWIVSGGIKYENYGRGRSRSIQTRKESRQR